MIEVHIRLIMQKFKWLPITQKFLNKYAFIYLCTVKLSN